MPVTDGLDWPITSAELRNQTPYNTSVHKGLPPTPIGNPGLASMLAAAKRPYRLAARTLEQNMKTPNWCCGCCRSVRIENRAFTLIELLVVITNYRPTS